MSTRLLELALARHRIALQKRQALIRNLESRLEGNKADPAALLRRSSLIFQHLRHTALIEQSREREFSIPFIHELSSAEWLQHNGREMLVHALERYRVIPDIFLKSDFDRLAFNLSVCHCDEPLPARSFPASLGLASRGEILPVSRIQRKPARILCDVPAGLHLNLLLVDCDYPDTTKKEKFSYCHWIASVAGGAELEVKEVVPFVPIHPYRGTDYHRYVYCLIEGDVPELEDISKGLPYYPEKYPRKRRINLRSVLDNPRSQLVGASLFRSTWSKAVSLELENDFAFGVPLSISEPRRVESLYKYS